MNLSYIITSGWWSSKEEHDTRLIKVGEEFIRSKEFHNLWYKAIKNFTKPKKIYIIDSNSPIKPDLHEDEELIELIKNAGHSTNHIGKICGVSRAHLVGMMMALANEVDYWVYIEQDALIYGNNIIENAIFKMKKPYMFGCGWETPQPVQQSFMIIKTSYIPKFIKNFTSIKARDNEISPEVKFAISTSWLRFLPEFLFKDIYSNNLKNKVIWKLFKLFQGFDELPFGYGRVRPINFNDNHFYFQHGDKNDLNHFLNKYNKINEK